MSEWQSIVTAPHDGRDVLLCAKPPSHTRWKYGIGAYVSFKESHILFDWDWSFEPTHWQPLPDPPAVGFI